MSKASTINDLDKIKIVAPQNRVDKCWEQIALIKKCHKTLVSDTDFWFKGIRNAEKLKKKTEVAVNKFTNNVKEPIYEIYEFISDYFDSTSSISEILIKEYGSLVDLISEQFKKLNCNVDSLIPKELKKSTLPRVIWPINSEKQKEPLKLRKNKTCSSFILISILKETKHGFQECMKIFDVTKLKEIKNLEDANAYDKTADGQGNVLVKYKGVKLYKKGIKDLDSREILSNFSELDQYSKQLGIKIRKMQNDKFVILKKTKVLYAEIFRLYNTYTNALDSTERNMDLFISNYGSFADLKRKFKYYTSGFEGISPNEVVDFVKKYNRFYNDSITYISKTLNLYQDPKADDESRLAKANSAYNTVKAFYAFLVKQRDSSKLPNINNFQKGKGTDEERDKIMQNLITQAKLLNDAVKVMIKSLETAKDCCEQIEVLLPQKKDDSALKQNVQRIAMLITTLLSLLLIL